METLESLIARARADDADAFADLVRRFQDMAVGYSYSILRDFYLAQDAAQEAFFEAYRELGKLREPAAFPGWFRRIVFKQCDRLIRNKSLSLVSLEAALARPSGEPGQADLLEQQEMKDKIWEVVDSLPEHERVTIMLFYISGYSHKEVGEFLGVPVSTVKKRLHSGRNRLRELLVDVVQDTLREYRPSRDEAFTTRVLELLKAARAGDLVKVKELLEQDPRLRAARDPLGNTALILAVNSGHNEVAELILSSGIRLDIYEAAAIGRTERVAELAQNEPEAVNSFSPEGFSPLALAAHFGHVATVEFLLANGADVNSISAHEMKLTPLHAALFGRRVEAARLLIAHGADPNIRRGGKGWPRSGWTALHYVAGYGFVDLIEPLLNRGAATDLKDDFGKTALDVALEAGQETAANALRRSGAPQ